MALGELECPSLSYVYDMTWAEFCIRLYAYNRKEKKSLYNLRYLAYNNTIAPYRDPKKIPSTIEGFMPLDFDKKEEQRQLIKDLSLKVINKYLQDKSKNN